jgi:L-iditol 2-dehydrogenase
VETNAERLALARQFGAHATVDSSKQDAEKVLKELTRGEGVDLALDCTGVAAARLAAVRSAKTWGTVCFVGEGGEVTLDVSRDLLRKQLTLIGSWTFSATGMGECARYIADNKIPLERIFTHRWKLDQVQEAYRVFDAQSSGKGVIEF